MRRLLAIVLLGSLTFFQAPLQAQPRYYNEGELEALLAPIALYPDPLLSQVLMASTYPADVHEAAAWSRANPHLKGEEAVRAAQDQPWDPSVKSLLAFPDVLARMDESPQWTSDLGQAFLAQEPRVMDAVQELRRRAQASGYLPNDHTLVQQQGSSIVLYPAQPQLVYVPYYDPFVVYGHWWWPAYRPVYWRPWRPAPVFVSATFFFGTLDWHRRYVTVVRQPTFVHKHRSYPYAGRWRHVHTRPAPVVQRYVPVPEAARQPIVRSLPPALPVESPRRAQPRHKRAEVARPVAPAVRVQPGFERREIRDERREWVRPPKDERQAEVAGPIGRAMRVHPGLEQRDLRPRAANPNSARLSSPSRGKAYGHRDAGGRHAGGARRNAPHARRKN